MTKETETRNIYDIPVTHFPDRSARWLLSNIENVRGLLEILAGELVEYLDFSKMRIVNTSFMPNDLQGLEADVVLIVPFRDESRIGELLISILIEHQSTVDPAMALRVETYRNQIWRSQRREWELNKVSKSRWRLRQVIPIVFYTGEQHWNLPLTLDAIMDIPDVLRRFVPKFDILFLSVKETPEEILTQTDHPFGWLLTVLKKEHASKDEMKVALIKALSRLRTILDDEQVAQWEQAILYLFLLTVHLRPPEEFEELKPIFVEQALQTKERDIMETMADLLIAEGFEQGEKRGEKRGETRAKREAVLKLLRLRFESIPESVTKKITSMRSHSRLDSLFETAATAQTLDDIDLENHKG